MEFFVVKIFCRLLFFICYREGVMMINYKIKKLMVLVIMIVLDVFLMFIFRIEGMVFMFSVVNIIVGVIMGLIYVLVMVFVMVFICILI